MRTNIVIDDDLLQRAMRVTGAKTKREVVELGLASLIRLKEQERNPPHCAARFVGQAIWTR